MRCELPLTTNSSSVIGLVIDVTPSCPRSGRSRWNVSAVRACLSNSFAFGGLNAVLALRKFA
jgi:3-oxoacyl-(acyl-carrier-protein) synthase